MKYLKSYKLFENRLLSEEETNIQRKLDKLNGKYMNFLFEFAKKLGIYYGIKGKLPFEGYLTNTESEFLTTKKVDTEDKLKYIDPIIRLKLFTYPDDTEGISRLEKEGFNRMPGGTFKNELMYCKDIPLTKYEGQKEILSHYPQLTPILKEFKILPEIEKEFNSVLKQTDWS